MARIKTVKAALNRMFKNEAIYFNNGHTLGQIQSIAICDGATRYDVELKDGRRIDKILIQSSYFWSDKEDLYR